jgi:hypothetical protein
MKDTIYLVADRAGIRKMTKSLPVVGRDQIPVKLTIEVDPKAFQTPVLERSVTIMDWRDGIDLEDVRFTGNFITEEEAEVIKQRRIAKMREILENQGYTVSVECTHGDGCLVHEGGVGCD